MKNLLAVLLCFFLGSVKTISQTCIPYVIVFTTQSQVDAFPSNYPGCSIIEGNVAISGNDITNLNGLSQLTQVLGSIQIINSNSLLNCNGLNNLTYIGGSLRLSNLTASPDIKFNNLLNIGLDIIIDVNTSGISEFMNVLTIGRNLDIQNQIISGFNNLLTIGGYFRTQNGSITGFNNLRSVQNYVSIFQAEDINGLLSLDTIGNYLAIFQNSVELDISVLDDIKLIGETIHFSGNVQNFGNFIHIDTIPGSLYISDNPVLETITGFSNIKIINGTLGFTNNPVLTAITGFTDLEYLGDLEIGDNIFLSDISGFDHPITFGYPPNISNNIFLSNCDVEAVCYYAWHNWNGVYYNNGIGCGTRDQIRESCPTPPDSDNDGHFDGLDNCPYIFNPNQHDANGDDEGDACDIDSDSDGDGIFDSTDNCVSVYSVDQNDANGNGIGDACDDFSDTDFDNYYDPYDNCPSIANPTQSDSDLNGIGDACQDDDGDGIYNDVDNCIDVSNPDQLDDNNNGYGNACEPDDTDGDGVFDFLDNCPSVSNADQADCDQDAIGDACEALDTDCDGVPDITDNCITVSNFHQTDLNSNGIGDACETFPKVGFNTEDPKSEIHLANGSIYLDNPEKGLIIKGYDGLCYRIIVVSGALESTQIPCPQ